MNLSVSARLLVAATVASLVATAAACPSEVAAGCKGTKCETGPVLPPRFYADPPFGIGFDCVVVGCEQDKHVMVENRGGGKLMVSLARLSTDTSTDFTLRRADDVNLPNPDNQLTLAAGEKVELVVTYVPSDGRPDEGAIVFEHYDGATPYIESTPRTDEIPVTTRTLGSAVASLSAGEVLDFGYVALGESKTLNIQVQNDGTDAVLRIGPTTAEEGSPEVFAPPTAGAWGEDFANPAGVVEIPVTYTPVAAEASFGAVLVQTNDGAFPSLRVALMGTAIPTPRLQSCFKRGPVRAGHRFEPCKPDVKRPDLVAFPDIGRDQRFLNKAGLAGHARKADRNPQMRNDHAPGEERRAAQIPPPERCDAADRNAAGKHQAKKGENADVR